MILPKVDRDDSSLCPWPRIPQHLPDWLSIGDRISLDRAHVDISADLGGAIVEDSFEVKTTEVDPDRETGGAAC